MEILECSQAIFSEKLLVRGQATKGERWMPWRWEAMKGVASCDKPRGAASRHRSGDARMGEPGWGNAHSSGPEYIGSGTRTEGTETSQYLEEEKENSIPQVAASERGTAQTGFGKPDPGLRDHDKGQAEGQRNGVEI